MECVLLGTGAADGWPNPFCGCASCAAASAGGEVRGQTAALVDDVLLLDCGPEAPRAATRHGHDLTRVRHVLLTHAHPDHTGPPALLWRHWAGRREPLDLVGPQAAVEACRPWVGPDDPVRLRPVVPGASLRLGDEPDAYAVQVLAAAHEDGAVLYDLTAPDGARLLYATDTGPLPAETLEAVSGARFDVVLLEETFGRVGDHGTGHLDLATFGPQVARLREAGAVTDATDLVAVHLGHHNPPASELGPRLASWGARVVPDGTLLRARELPGRARPARPPLAVRPRRTLVLGGARSGKSTEAERLLAAEPEVTYVATGGTRDDPDWRARVAAHRARRPVSWRTEETADVAGVLDRACAPVLVDCLTLWLTSVLDGCGAWDDTVPDDRVAAAVDGEVDRLVQAWRATSVPVVAVSNEVGSGVHPATPPGRLFRDLMGRVNATLAAESDAVLLVVAGRVLAL